MKQAEIDFCVRWLGFRDSDGNVWGGEYLYPDFAGAPAVAVRATAASGVTIYDLTPRGADLVASYEAALVLGLDIVADDAPKTSGRIDCDPDGRERAGRYDDCAFCVGDACNRCGWDLRMGNTRGCDCDVVDRHEPRRAPREPSLVDCPDCDDGTIGIPVAYAANGGVLRVWPSTCQRCKGSGQVESLAEIGRPLEGLGQELDDANRRLVGAARSWQKLTAKLSAELKGQTVEVCNADMVRRHLAGVYRIGPRRESFTQLQDPDSGARVDGIPSAWHVRVVDEPKTAAPRDLEWRKLTREVAEGLVGKAFDARGPDGTIHHAHGDLVGLAIFLTHGAPVLPLDGNWWVRGVAS